jgi:hypothetical protein
MVFILPLFSLYLTVITSAELFLQLPLGDIKVLCSFCSESNNIRCFIHHSWKACLVIP